MSSMPFSASSGARRDQRRDVEVLERADLARAGSASRTCSTGPCARRATTTGSTETTAARTRSSIAARNSVQVAPYDKPAAPMRSGSTSGCAREHVERRVAGPRGCAGAGRRRPSWRTRDPSRSGTCRRASSRCARRSRAGRARARRSRRTRARARTARPRRAPPRAHRRYAPSRDRDRGSRASRGRARCDRAARAGTRAPTWSLRCRTRRARARYVPQSTVSVDLEVERHGLGRGPEHREHSFRARALATARARRQVVERARIGVDRRLVLQPPVRPVREVASAVHARQSSRGGAERPAESARRGAAGTPASPTHRGSARGWSRTPAPRLRVKHHASG